MIKSFPYSFDWSNNFVVIIAILSLIGIGILSFSEIIYRPFLV